VGVVVSRQGTTSPTSGNTNRALGQLSQIIRLFVKHLMLVVSIWLQCQEEEEEEEIHLFISSIIHLAYEVEIGEYHIYMDITWKEASTFKLILIIVSILVYEFVIQLFILFHVGYLSHLQSRSLADNINFKHRVRSLNRRLRKCIYGLESTGVITILTYM